MINPNLNSYTSQYLNPLAKAGFAFEKPPNPSQESILQDFDICSRPAQRAEVPKKYKRLSMNSRIGTVTKPGNFRLVWLQAQFCYVSASQVRLFRMKATRPLYWETFRVFPLAF